MADELISRHALLKELATHFNMVDGRTLYHPSMALAMHDVRNAPAVDAVEVVRCKDCKWYEPCTEWGIDATTGRYDHSKIIKKPYGECHGQDFVFTEAGCLRVGDDDFCSYGKRREENA